MAEQSSNFSVQTGGTTIDANDILKTSVRR